jgi:hypothetical protein
MSTPPRGLNIVTDARQFQFVSRKSLSRFVY